jgi:hypothetical protein
VSSKKISRAGSGITPAWGHSRGGPRAQHRNPTEYCHPKRGGTIIPHNSTSIPYGRAIAATPARKSAARLKRLVPRRRPIHAKVI